MSEESSRAIFTDHVKHRQDDCRLKGVYLAADFQRKNPYTDLKFRAKSIQVSQIKVSLDLAYTKKSEWGNRFILLTQ